MKFYPVPNYEGLYEVSKEGIIRSKERVILGRDGIQYPFKPKIKAQHPNPATGYLTTTLYKNNVCNRQYVHRVVAETFLNKIEGSLQVNHIDGDKENNNVSNLEWVSHQENVLHAVRTGLRKYTNKLSRDQFIECLKAVIEGESYSSLSLRVPYKVPFLSTKLRKIAKEENLEHLLDESLDKQRKNRSRKNGAKNK